MELRPRPSHYGKLRQLDQISTGSISSPESYIYLLPDTERLPIESLDDLGPVAKAISAGHAGTIKETGKHNTI